MLQVIIKERMNNTINEELFEIIELLRNGAIISGDDMYTNLYRIRCLEQVYHRICSNNVCGKLFEQGILNNQGSWNRKWQNLLDITPLHTKTYIRPEFSGVRPHIP